MAKPHPLLPESSPLAKVLNAVNAIPDMTADEKVAALAAAGRLAKPLARELSWPPNGLAKLLFPDPPPET